MKFVSALGFGGALDLGATQSGMQLVGRKELVGGYGALNILANRGLLGHAWDTQVSADKTGEDWDAIPGTQMIIGSPPCSGFSTLSRASFRGEGSKINECMWAIANYTGRVAPEVMCFESVQQAFTQGRDLMAGLRARLEELSGAKYTIWHVLHNNLSLGGCSLRRRYFFVCSRVPFGVERVKLDRIPVLSDVFADLDNLGLTWERQPYKSPPTWWSAQMRDGTGTVDGHATIRTPYFERVLDLVLGPHAVEWLPGENVSTICRRYYTRYGNLPRSWYYESKNGVPKADILISTDFNMGFNQLTRWHADKPARVITGGGCQNVLHPTQLRTITHREAARIQGFPDAWHVRPLQGIASVASTWGKGAPVHAGRWITTWIKASIEGKPGSYTGEPAPTTHKGCKLDEDTHARELVIDVTNDWKDTA